MNIKIGDKILDINKEAYGKINFFFKRFYLEIPTKNILELDFSDLNNAKLVVSKNSIKLKKYKSKSMVYSIHSIQSKFIFNALHFIRISEIDEYHNKLYSYNFTNKDKVIFDEKNLVFIFKLTKQGKE